MNPTNLMEFKKDVYQLGEHRLMCGDSTKTEDYEKLMDGNKAQMVFTDPPYNVDYQGGGSYANHKDGKNSRPGIINDKMTKNNFYQFLFEISKNLCQFCAGGIYICMSSSELDTLKIAFEQGGGRQHKS